MWLIQADTPELLITMQPRNMIHCERTSCRFHFKGCLHSYCCPHQPTAMKLGARLVVAQHNVKHCQLLRQLDADDQPQSLHSAAMTCNDPEGMRRCVTQAVAACYCRMGTAIALHAMTEVGRSRIQNSAQTTHTYMYLYT